MKKAKHPNGIEEYTRKNKKGRIIHRWRGWNQGDIIGNGAGDGYFNRKEMIRAMKTLMFQLGKFLTSELNATEK